MILTRDEIQEEIDKKRIRFDPPLEDRQWGDVCLNLPIGYKFTKLKKANLEISLADGIAGLATELWMEKTYPHFDELGKRQSFTVDPGG